MEHPRTWRAWTRQFGQINIKLTDNIIWSVYLTPIILKSIVEAWHSLYMQQSLNFTEIT